MSKKAFAEGNISGFSIKDLQLISFTEMCLFYSKIKAFILDKQNTNNLIAAIITHKKV